MQANIRIEGLTAAIQRFKSAGGKIPSRSTKKALRASSKPVIAAAKVNAPRETGALRRAMSAKEKSYRSGKYQLAIVGPKNFKYASGRNPGKYGHLVELGHRSRNGGFVAARNFLGLSARQAYPAALRIYELYFRANIIKDFS